MSREFLWKGWRPVLQSGTLGEKVFQVGIACLEQVVSEKHPRWSEQEPTQPETGERLEPGEGSLLPSPVSSAAAANSGREMGQLENPMWLGLFPPSVVQYLNNQCHEWVCAMPGWLMHFSDQLWCVVFSHMIQIPSFTFKHVMEKKILWPRNLPVSFQEVFLAMEWRRRDILYLDKTVRERCPWWIE